jgi:hypothetical protein
MLAPQALVRSLVQRLRPPQPAPEGVQNDMHFRLASYGELHTIPLVRKSHGLLDEGSYYTANNGQTGIASAYNTAFTATAPFLSVYNGNAVGGLSAFIDYLALVAIAAGAQTTTAGYIAAASVLDSGNRYSSGGTALTPANSDPSNSQPTGLTINAGAVTASAATGNARTQVGIRNLRPSVSTTVINVVGDMNLINFGSVEGATGSITIANANIMPQAFPPVKIPPQYTWLFYLFYPAMSAPSAATFAPELGFWMR